MAEVKTRGSRRREQANATRRRIVDAAYELFSAAGYPATTMDAVADRAGVAVQTVYHVFNTKAVLLRAVIEVAAAGRHDATPEPAWILEAIEEADARRALAITIEHGVDVQARVAPLIGAINAAASTDPSFADFWDASCKVRRRGTADLVAGFSERGQLQAGLATQRAADILYAIGAYETVLALLTVCGWSLEEVKAWYYELSCEQLLSPQVGRGRRTKSGEPTAGLSFDHLVAA
jgi:AcrR family transcriptional regulator